MTDIDLDALEATARAATPGPWEWEPPSDNRWVTGDESLVTSDPGEDGYPDVVLSGWGHDASGTEASDEDRAHIATFDPPTVLALIARLREAEAVIDTVEGNMWRYFGEYLDGDNHDPVRTAITRYKTTKTEENER